MSDINNCCFSGNLCKDADIRVSPAGKKVVKFDIAVNGYKERTDFVRVVYFANNDYFDDKLSKGKKVCLYGSLRIDKVDKDGTDTFYTSVIARDIVLV